MPGFQILLCNLVCSFKSASYNLQSDTQHTQPFPSWPLKTHLLHPFLTPKQPNPPLMLCAFIDTAPLL